jgi:hypothetical protein
MNNAAVQCEAVLPPNKVKARVNCVNTSPPERGLLIAFEMFSDEVDREDT